uniref:Uncharacterized protein n=1 Tax=Rangifer tarandus platyrhynchus TaxID=3082113 RepID=A0ACB0EJF5_RANTA|nr:unnamed protein product [Rangifer tarandus platyrhynchus]
MHYRGAQAAVVAYDITNEESFARAKTWVKELQSVGAVLRFPATARHSSERRNGLASPVVPGFAGKTGRSAFARQLRQLELRGPKLLGGNT